VWLQYYLSLKAKNMSVRAVSEGDEGLSTPPGAPASGRPRRGAPAPAPAHEEPLAPIAEDDEPESPMPGTPATPDQQGSRLPI